MTAAFEHPKYMKLLNSHGLYSFCMSPRQDSSEEANGWGGIGREHTCTQTNNKNICFYVCMRATTYTHIFFSFKKITLDFRKPEILCKDIQCVSNRDLAMLSDCSYLGNNTKKANAFVTM